MQPCNLPVTIGGTEFTADELMILNDCIWPIVEMATDANPEPCITIDKFLNLPLEIQGRIISAGIHTYLADHRTGNVILNQSGPAGLYQQWIESILQS